MEYDFVPMYRDVKNIKDVHHNQQQMIQAFNHGMTKLGEGMKTLSKSNLQSANDIRWIKRFVFGLSGFIGLIIVGAIGSYFGWVN